MAKIYIVEDENIHREEFYDHLIGVYASFEEADNAAFSDWSHCTRKEKENRRVNIWSIDVDADASQEGWVKEAFECLCEDGEDYYDKCEKTYELRGEQAKVYKRSVIPLPEDPSRYGVGSESYCFQSEKWEGRVEHYADAMECDEEGAEVLPDENYPLVWDELYKVNNLCTKYLNGVPVCVFYTKSE